MDLKEFIIDFANNHQLKHIDDYDDGIIEEYVAKDIYLIQSGEVHQR